MSEEGVKFLIKKRGGLKSAITRISSAVSHSEPNVSKHFINVRLASLKNLANKYDEIQSEIELQVEESDIAADDRIEVEELLFSTEAKILELLEHSVHVVESRHVHSNIQLQPIKLPCFSGDILEWQHFNSMFMDLIHTRSDLSAVQKFHYLHSALKNEPLNLIKSLPVCEENYNVALDLLSDRYSNSLLIARYYVQNLLNVKSIQKESAQNLSDFISTISSSLNSLDAMKLSVSSFELIIIQLLASKLDANTAKLWTESLSDEVFPTYRGLIQFLNSRRQILENVSTSPVGQQSTASYIKPTNKVTNYKPHGSPQQITFKSYHTVANVRNCMCCKGAHSIYACGQFKKYSLSQRKQFVEQNKCCMNCLSNNHNLMDCKSRQTCKICARRHHTLLHGSSELKSGYAGGSSYCALKQQSSSGVILSTAIVNVIDSAGNRHRARVLLDSGSQTNFCTERFAKKLKLNLHKTKTPIVGINNASCISDSIVSMRILSRYLNFSFMAQCVVLPNVTHYLPSMAFDVTTFNIPDNIFLADPHFNIPAEIDILIGAQFYLNLIQPIQLMRGLEYPIIQETKLGFILAGNLPNYSNSGGPTLSCIARHDVTQLSDSVQRFWEAETIPESPNFVESHCEDHFIQSTVRGDDGKFVVSLPFSADVHKLGNSYSNAEARFLSLERRFKRDPSFKLEYSKFINEYIELGHMSSIDDPNTSSTDVNAYYLPHHAVFKNSSSTTRLRVVFDGSAKTDSDLSLNDVLFVGPNVQHDLFSILVRFRTHNYVLVADIEKMYRQIWVALSDCNFQRILWRDSPHQEIKHFMLRTVTYGTASASFLATRCLVQIGRSFKDSFPLAAASIINDFYVDDLISGADTVDDLSKLRDDLNMLLSQYGFKLHKWASNVPAVVFDDSVASIPLSKENNVRTLGVLWDNTSDSLTYKMNLVPISESVFTKRYILSVVAGIYDPLGLVGPVVFLFKHFLQGLWISGVGWDDPISGQLYASWSELYEKLPSISDIIVQRSIRHVGEVEAFELFGFADASQKGYGCCVYIRLVYRNRRVSSNLLCAKSRIAPRQQVSLPRLELCACLLLSRLVNKVSIAIGARVHGVHLFSDSTIALHWIHAPSSKWKTYVANRVSEVQGLTSTFTWHHIGSSNNPADIISRGCLPDSLSASALWWHGPSFLSDNFVPDSLLPFATGNTLDSNCLAEERQSSKVSLTSRLSIDFSLDFSSLHRLTRVFSYCFRFIRNSQAAGSNGTSGVLTSSEINRTLNFFVKQSQIVHFSTEIDCLLANNALSVRSKLCSLDPFLDDSGMLRVGGRLQHSQLSYNVMHPLILHPSAHITRLIIKSEHLRLLHAGVQLTHNSLRQLWWIVKAKVAVRSVIRGCLTCFRFDATAQSQKLGTLPSPRVTPSRPFLSCAVDYGGPFVIRHGGQKSKSVSKAYVALFVCLATRAVHLELVSDLSAFAFIAALRRFISRRGIPSRIYSDNGTNFKGARNILRDIYLFWRNKETSSSIQTFAASQGISWFFIPPSSPHFGGLWESGVKSVKFHLRRIVGRTVLNFEEFSTVLSQVEACLNSRPLFAVSSDVNDPVPLTPGHFLICSPLMALPDSDYADLAVSRLGRWQLLQQFVQSLWKAWSRDYLHQLQQRHKWRFAKENVSVGDLVVLIEDNLPPLFWKFGIITATFPGPDKLIRVVDVRTSAGIYRRPVHKLCLLPACDESNAS